MTGWWMLDESQCLDAVLKVEVATSAKNGIPVIHPVSTQVIALPYPVPILIPQSCIMSYKFTHSKPVAGHY